MAHVIMKGRDRRTRRKPGGSCDRASRYAGELVGTRDRAFIETIRSIPPGKVSTYGQIAAAAGYPRYHRAVARLLKSMAPGECPWQRVVGAGGEIKVAGRAAAEQRFRLKLEGVTFAGKRVNLARHQHVFDLA